MRSDSRDTPFRTFCSESEVGVLAGDSELLTVELESRFPFFRALVDVEGIFPFLRRGDVLVEFGSLFRRCDDESRSGIHDHRSGSVRDLAVDSSVTLDRPVCEEEKEMSAVL